MQPSGAQVAELVALADDTLPPGRRTSALQKIERSPELSAQLELQRRVVAAIRAWDVQAPASLRARIEHDAQVVRPPVQRRRERAAAAITVGLAVAALLALLVVPSSPSGPTVVEAAELTRRGSSGPAPLPLPGRPALLSQSVAGVPFPNYAAKLGWRAYGGRSDRFDGRLLRRSFTGEAAAGSPTRSSPGRRSRAHPEYGQPPPSRASGWATCARAAPRSSIGFAADTPACFRVPASPRECCSTSPPGEPRQPDPSRGVSISWVSALFCARFIPGRRPTIRR